MYDELLAAAAEAGFHQYEVANFARHFSAVPGRRPIMPAGTTSIIGAAVPFMVWAPARPVTCAACGPKMYQIRNVYCDRLEHGLRAIESSEELSPLARAGEIAAFGLRMTSGWPLVQFQERTGFELQQEWGEEIKRMLDLGYGKLDGQRFQLTRQGLRYADWAASEFLRS